MQKEERLLRRDKLQRNTGMPTEELNQTFEQRYYVTANRRQNRVGK